ncbi:terminase large subunit [Tenacibaculum phage JQ]|nr:terminase large subunit [Tenacibaculum phage JQ]
MELTREELAIARVKCDNSLLFFTRFFYRLVFNQKFIINWHHEELCKHFEDLTRYKLDLLNINIPPRCSKTLIMMMAICRGIGQNHSSNYLYITASDNLRKKTTTDIRRILTHPYFKIMYGLEISKDQNSKDVIGFTGGGSLTTASIFGQITGFGAGQMVQHEEEYYLKDEEEINKIFDRPFEGGIFCDDLDKISDAVKENANNKNVNDILFNTVFSRKNSKDTPLSNIQQRAGLSDTTSALMDYYGDNNKRARFVIMPVIDEKGKLLWEWRYPLDEITRLKTSTRTKHTFETQYMQNPQPQEGAMFREDELQRFSLNDLDMSLVSMKVGAIDVSDTGKDYFSFPSGVLIGERFYITDWLYTQENTEYTRPTSAALINREKINHVAVETNSFGIEFYRNLENETSSSTNMYGVHQTGNKHHRIINKAEFIRKHFVFRNDVDFNSDYDKALKHLFRYMKDGSFKIDDAPDSLALLAQLLQELTGI